MTTDPRRALALQLRASARVGAEPVVAAKSGSSALAVMAVGGVIGAVLLLAEYEVLGTLVLGGALIGGALAEKS
jgi:hypothetical protein